MRLNNLLKLSLIAVLLSNCAFADFKEHFDLGQQYLANYQYSSAITEFKNALRINFMDNSARIGLINSYLARGMYYGKEEKNYEKAADDYRSALFYMVYYPTKNTSSPETVSQVTGILNRCLNATDYNTSPENRFNTAKQLRAEGNFAAAAYEFNQTLADRDLQKESFEQVGDVMKLLGNNQKAAEYYRKAIAVAPTDIDLRLDYAKMLDNLGNEDAAVAEYNYILSKTTDNKEVLYALERIYKKKLENSPSDADITANLGAILQKQGKYDDALMYYQKSEYLNPSNINTRLNVGTLYQQKGDPRTAIKAYDSVLILYPDNVNANLYKAQAYAALGDTKSAISGYQKVLALDPANTDAQTQMLNLVKGSMTTSQFIDYVKKNFAASNPADLFYSYALDLHKQNKLADAITMYNEALKLNTKNPEIYLNLAIAQNQAGTPNEALNTLKTASSAFPSNAQIKDAINSITKDAINNRLAKAASYYDVKDYRNAINEYSKINPPTVDSMLGIASSYQAMEDYDNAIKYYQEALKLKPVDSDIPYYIAVLYAQKEDWNNAKNYLNKSLAINKNNTKSLDFMQSVNEQLSLKSLNEAISLYENEKYDASLKLLNQILSTDVSNAYAYYYRGMIYDVKEQRQQAIDDFKKAYSLNKEFTILNYMIAADYDALGNTKEALKYYTDYANSNAEDDEYKQYAKARAEELKQNGN